MKESYLSQRKTANTACSLDGVTTRCQLLIHRQTASGIDLAGPVPNEMNRNIAVIIHAAAIRSPACKHKIPRLIVNRFTHRRADLGPTHPQPQAIIDSRRTLCLDP